MGDLPLMTKPGTFVINGSERVIVIMEQGFPLQTSITKERKLLWRLYFWRPYRLVMT